MDLNKDGRVHVGIRKCKVPKVVLMHGVDGIENCLIITIIYVFELFEQQRFFCLTLATRYCKSLVGNDYFWPTRNVLAMEDALCFYCKMIFSRRVLTTYEIGKCLVRMNLFP